MAIKSKPLTLRIYNQGLWQQLVLHFVLKEPFFLMEIVYHVAQLLLIALPAHLMDIALPVLLDLARV